MKEEQVHYQIISTVLGYLTIAAKESGISHLLFGKYPPKNGMELETPLLKQAAAELDDYLNGSRKKFEVPLAPEGTTFQLKVWEALCTIPYGETRTYSQIAYLAGNPKACRAVGMANNRNPISIFIPCHRVIGKNGSLVGYGGGLFVKEYLLKLEACPSTSDTPG